MLSLSFGETEVYSGNDVNYSLLISEDINVRVKVDVKERKNKYYDVVLKNANGPQIYLLQINIGSKYPETVIKYKIPVKEDIMPRGLELVLYSSDTQSGEVVQRGLHYPIKAHIKAFSLKKIDSLFFNVRAKELMPTEKERLREIQEKKWDREYKSKIGTLTLKEQRWCRCLLRQASVIMRYDDNFYKNIESDTCLHYGTNISKNDCSNQYVLGNLNLSELIGYAKIFHIPFKLPTSKFELKRLIENYLYKKRKH